MSEATVAGAASPSRSGVLWLALFKPLWLAYSVAFGVVGPLVCFGVVVHANVLADWSGPLFVYALSCVVTLVAWFAFGRKLAVLDAWLAGALAAAAIFAVVSSMIVVPLAVFAVMAVGKEPEIAAIGLLGFLAPLACPAFALAAWRAAESARRARKGTPIVFAAIASLALPIAVHAAIDRACSHDAQLVLDTNRALDELDLGRWRTLAEGRRWNELVDAYRPLRANDQLDEPRAKRIADAYELATGKPIRWRFYD